MFYCFEVFAYLVFVDVLGLALSFCGFVIGGLSLLV